MGESTVFEKIVMDLSSDERRELLSKIKKASNVSIEPLSAPSRTLGKVDFVEEYKSLGFWQRIILFFKSLFRGKTKTVVLEEELLAKLRKKIEKTHASLVNFQHRCLLPNMKREFLILMENLIRLREPFQKALGKDKGAFFAFLTSFQLEYLHERILEETNPNAILEENENLKMAEVRGEMEKRFNAVLKDMTEEERNRIYQSALSLHYIKRLCFFNFEQLVTKFDDPKLGGSGNLNFNSSKRELLELSDLLHSAKYPPDADSIKAVFLFYFQQDMEGALEDIELKMENMIDVSETAFNSVRSFNKKIPLEDMIRIFMNNYNYKPRLIKGNEDWFVLFKNYWNTKLNKVFTAAYKKKKISLFFKRVNAYLGVDRFPVPFKNMKFEMFGKGYSVRFYLSLSFLYTFYTRVYSVRMAKTLKYLLLNGEFYKKENRKDFTDSLNFVTSIGSKILELDEKLSEEGPIGQRIRSLGDQSNESDFSESSLVDILKEADAIAKWIIDESITQIFLLSQLLNGVLHGQVGGKFDTISNLMSIGGKENNDLLTAMKNILSLLSQGTELLKDVYQIELRE
ncbi:MAG: hypothetical protein JW969_16215 [Spirochaetales bacterium]|nr:hypothetical protein [Spirochaetales bacterium]